MDYHFVYKDVEGTSTEWDDIQRRLGNLPPKPEIFKPPPFAPSEDPELRLKSKDWIDERTAEELEGLEDDPDIDDNRFLEEYRKRRLAEMQAAARVARFGAVLLITGSDFVREVSQAPSDVWVVVLLFKDGIPGCELLLQCLEELAARYPGTKFVKIVSTDCIPKYPDHNLPTILVYNNGAVKGTYVGLHHFGSRRCTPEAVALALCKCDPVLNDGNNTCGLSKNAVVEGESKRLIEKFVKQHEDEEDYSSD
uniref:Phosducin-like protein 3 n=1 Tax=Dendrobium officinale TaxID=142615 RepID=A0A1J0CN60_DENOF|nr:phosducin-like protein 3 [Dendrobium officinale]